MGREVAHVAGERLLKKSDYWLCVNCAAGSDRRPSRNRQATGEVPLQNSKDDNRTKIIQDLQGITQNKRLRI